jgi:hypothetical protein
VSPCAHLCSLCGYCFHIKREHPVPTLLDLEFFTVIIYFNTLRSIHSFSKLCHISLYGRIILHFPKYLYTGVYMFSGFAFAGKAVPWPMHLVHMWACLWLTSLQEQLQGPRIWSLFIYWKLQSGSPKALHKYAHPPKYEESFSRLANLANVR